MKLFKGQNYEELKQRFSRDNLFIDDQFPPNDKSLYYSKNNPYALANIVWRRASVTK